MFAVVKTGGKQYRVAPGDIIIVERLLGDAGAKIKLDQVLMVGEDGKSAEVGTPLLGNAAVNCEIIDQSRADKVIVFKKKRRQGYKRTKGHRQDQTVLRVLDINGKRAVKSAAKKATKPAKEKKSAETQTDTKTADAPSKTVAPAETKAATKKKVATKKKATAKKKAATKKKTAAKKKAAAKKSTTSK